MQRTLRIKFSVAIVVLTFWLCVGITMGRTQSIPLVQNTPVTQVTRLKPIRYQGANHGKEARRIPAGTYYINCLTDAKNNGRKYLTALIPIYSPVLTTSFNPKIFFYIPKTPKTSVKAFKFSLVDANNQVIYKQTFKVNNQPGVFSLSLPANAEKFSLKVGQEYPWYFSAICDYSDRSNNSVLGGWLQLFVSNENLTMELNKASARDRAAIYAASGIWYDSLATLAELRQKHPDNAALKNDWQSLLESVNLAEIAQEPLVGELKPE